MTPTDPQPSAPVLSAILPAWDTFASIRATLAHLRRQTIAAHMEVILLCPDAASYGLQQEELAPFGAWRLVELGTMETRSQAFAEGVMAARGEFTVFCEDHCFPEPTWAEALIRRHREGDYAGVGAMFGNANPENSISDADFLLAYGTWMHGLPGGEMTYIPGHNSCYRREMLLREGDALPDVLESEYVLHTRYAEQGIKVYAEPAARVHHMNFATWSSALKATYLAGKVFGANRAMAWPLSRRLTFAVAWPAVPAMRLARILKLIRRAHWPTSRLLKSIPALIVCLLSSVMGEWIGNLLGRHSHTPSLVYYEFHRHRFSPAFDGHDLAAELHFGEIPAASPR